MSDTFNEFVKFISDDPLMLGLCIAIIVLIIIFILVLCFGGKKKPKAEEKVEENTTQLLKTDLNDEPLKSTQEFNLSQMQTEAKQEELEKTINVPNVEALEAEAMEMEAPISVEEAINLKTTREENELKNTIPIPVVEDVPATPVNIPVMPEVPTMGNVVETPKEEDVELPTMTIPETPVSGGQPFSSVYLNGNTEMPKNEDFSKTEVIRHIPVMEEVPPMPVDVPVATPDTQVSEAKADSFDDIDLPKLNTDSNNSVLSSLTGESFDINK